MPDLHIHQLEAELQDPAAAARLRGGLRRALDLALEGALLQAGVDPEEDLAIQSLDVEIDEAAGEERWAEAILGGLRDALADAPSIAPGASSSFVRAGADGRIARFPNRIASGRAALLAVARGAGVPWWWASLVGAEEARLLDGPLGAERVVLEWISREPAAAPAAVAALLLEGPSVLARFGAGAGPRLLAALLGARALRATELGLPPADGGPSTGPALDLERTMTLGQALARRLPAQERAALRLLEPSCALFFAVCLALRAMPGLTRPVEAGAALLEDLSGEITFSAVRTAGVSMLRREAGGPPEAEGVGGAAGPERGRVGEPRVHGVTVHVSRTVGLRASDVDLAIEFSVGLGGLLFLLRWLARDPLLAGDFASAAPGLAAFADLVLERVLAPLDPGERARVRLEHRLLLEVFVGSSRIEPDPDERERAEAALARLREALPKDLDPVTGALSWTLRTIADPLGAIVPEDRALAILVLRPGRLRIGAHRADLRFSHRFIDVELRKGGWDVDPGWFLWVGRTIRFHYAEGE